MFSILYGFLIGVFVSLIGGGGASLYLGVLTSQLHIPIATAAPTSLLIAIPALFFGFITQTSVGHVHFRIGNRLIISAIPSIIIGTLLSQSIPIQLYNQLVGIVLIIMGGLVLFKYVHHHETTRTPNSFIGILFGVLSGLMVGIGGLSGGATTVAGLTLMGLSALDAAGTTTYVLWVMATIGFLCHLFTSTIAWFAGLGIMIGAIIGSILTPLTIRNINPIKLNRFLTPILGIIIIYFGLQMLF
jgi:uncharacterized membrane protein YfcA